MNTTIEVTVDVDGKVVVQTLGFSGGACREASRALEQALGIVGSERLTSEFYQDQATGQQIRHSNGS